MCNFDERLTEWVERCILPHEAEVRNRLRRGSLSRAEIDDIVQEAYSRLMHIENVGAISNPRAYFWQVTRNVLLEQLRRSRIVRIDTVAEMESLGTQDDGPGQESVLISKQELGKLQRLIDALPDTCRKIFIKRKIEQTSQKEIAVEMGMTVSAVEAQIRRGFKLISNAWEDGETGVAGKSAVVQPKRIGDGRDKKRN